MNWEVLRRRSGLKRSEIVGGWRSSVICYSSPNVIRLNKCRRTNAQGIRYAWERSAYTILVGKPEGQRPLGTPRRRWEDNIKMNL
jgi:hypothetical protein